MNVYCNPASIAQRGTALLIAIFALVLISAAAAALIMMSGTESAINANYRRSTDVFYAAQGGLEEARERMVINAPDTLTTNALFPNATLPNIVTGQVLYILNPGPNDPAFNPQSDPATSPYYDSEYQQEFGISPVANPAQVVNSSNLTQAGNLPPLDYKWVRITLKSEQMGGVNLTTGAACTAGACNLTTPVLAQITGNQCLPSLPTCWIDPNAAGVIETATPVYRVTALALDRFGSKRLVQAEVAQMPQTNAKGAIASQAGVTINGNFNAFGSWPPLVTTTCGKGSNKTTVTTCGNYVKGSVVGDCSNIYNPTTDTCNGLPRSHNDYCNAAPAVDSVLSGGNISAGANYTEVPDQNTSCATTAAGCISTVSPNKALDSNVSNWPYNMDQLIAMWQPPASEPVTDFSGTSCGTVDSSGNRTCQGQGVQMGTMPNPWIPAPGVTSANNQPAFVYADVGRGGLLKLTGQSSGSGVLVVTGDLAINGGFQWYGLIIVRGTVTFLGGGSTGTNVVGGIIAGSDITNANTTAGGSVSVIYSSCALNNSNNSLALRYLSFREIAQ